MTIRLEPTKIDYVEDGCVEMKYRLQPRTQIQEISRKGWNDVDIQIGGIRIKCDNLEMPFISPNLVTFLILKFKPPVESPIILHVSPSAAALPEKKKWKQFLHRFKK